ncbi:putative LPS assembly protein LptD [Urechidicola sp. KH5]
MKNKSVLTLIFICTQVLTSLAQNTVLKSSLRSVNQTIINRDSIAAQPIDSLSLDSIPKPKGALDNIVTHNAKGRITEDFTQTLITLYDEAEVDYGDVNIKAGHITINHETNIITAYGIKDSTGYSQRPIVNQAGQESTHDTIKMNYKTERLIAWGTDASLEGFETHTSITKKVNDSTIYVRDIILTTSKKSPPDYHIKINSGKMIPEKKIVAGTSQMYIAEVPTPVVLPFAYFPLTKGRSSGLILPSYGNSREQGFFLQNGGYYLALSDYFDLAITGDIYTNSSWALGAQSSYVVRYKFSGGFNIRYENLYSGIRGLDDFAQSSNYNIRWNHSQDSKANPNSRFSASVNLGSSKYYRQSLNEYNSNSFLNNTLNSSVSWQKRFVGSPFNMSASMTHSQNTNTESIIMNLPSMQLSMDRIYPFAPKNGSKTNAFHNMGVVYNMRGDYRINTSDEEFFKREMFEDARAGIQQDVALSTNMKIAKHFTLSPNARYQEVWYFDKVEKNYDNDLAEIVTDTIRGFTSFREYNVGASISTTLYGDLKLKKGRLEAVRHTMRPSISYTYRPDFGFYYEEVQQSSDPLDLIEYSPFETGIYGGPSTGLSNSIGIAIANTLEAKVKPKDSTETESKKIKLLNNLNLATSYNMAADSLKWSPLSMNTGANLFNNKMVINLRATLDPYAIDVNGRKIDKFNIDNGGSLFRLTNAGLTANYTLNNDTFKKGGDKSTNSNAGGTSQRDPTGSDGIFGENMTASNDPSNNNDEGDTKKAKLYNAEIPWSMRLAYAFNYNNTARQNEVASHSIMFSGDVELTPKWQVGFSSGYDIKQGGFTYTQLRFNRDLDSWQMNFNWVPFGPRTTYNFYIGIKSGILSDVKYDQRQTPDRRLF